MKYFAFISISLLLLLGCSEIIGPDFDEVRCTVEIDVRIADDFKSSSHPSMRDNETVSGKTIAVSMPHSGDIWLTGRQTMNGVIVDSESAGWHEVAHVLAHNCKEFADPDKPETLFGSLFGWGK